MSKRRRETWTFQPDDDVVKGVAEVFGAELSRGKRTEIVNEALRIHHAETIISIAASDLEKAKARLNHLREIVTRNRQRAGSSGQVALDKSAKESGVDAAGLRKSVGDISSDHATEHRAEEIHERHQRKPRQ